MAGHPTIGSTFALARVGIIESPRANFVFSCGIGPVPVSMTWTAGDLAFVWMSQALPTFGEPLADLSLAAAALSLSPTAVAGTGLPVQVVSCGVPFLFVPLTTRSAVDGVSVNRSAFDELLREAKTNAHGLFVFSAQPGAERAGVYSRMFAPDLGIVEDPATGSASGPLGCYLVRHKVVAADKAENMVSLQGAKMGRPSHVHISIGVRDGEIASVRVGGEAVLAGEGTLYI